MRALMTAGEALNRDNVAGFNCSYLPIDHVKAFDELMYVLLCGTGVGYSVERQYISKLPEVAEEFMRPTQLFMWQIQRLDGRNRLGNWLRCCMQVKFPDGTLAELDLRVPRLRFLEVEQAAQNLCSTYFDSQLTSFAELLDESLAPLSVTISAVRLLACHRRRRSTGEAHLFSL